MRLAKYRIQNLFFFLCSWNSLRISRGVHRVRFFLSFNNCAGTNPPATPDDLDSTLAIYETDFVLLSAYYVLLLFVSWILHTSTLDQNELRDRRKESEDCNWNSSINVTWYMFSSVFTCLPIWLYVRLRTTITHDFTRLQRTLQRRRYRIWVTIGGSPILSNVIFEMYANCEMNVNGQRIEWIFL